jgi:FO synthase subunit 1
MRSLKQVNVSMGLMLEQLTPQLLQTVHRHAPSKVPEVRLQQLKWAGELRIPFTTGLLLGIGETKEDWWETMDAIAQLHSCYGHIQEVILQPHSPGTQQIGMLLLLIPINCQRLLPLPVRFSHRQSPSKFPPT